MNLKATSTYNGALGFTWNNKIVDVYWGGNMSYTPDAIMTSILPLQQADGSYLYVWKPENQKSFTSYFAYTTLVFHIIPEIFDVQGELQYQHLRSRGLDYSHDFEPLHYGLTASLNLKKWYVEYSVQHRRFPSVIETYTRRSAESLPITAITASFV